MKSKDSDGIDAGRRRFLGAAGAAVAGGTAAGPAWGGSTFLDAMGSFF